MRYTEISEFMNSFRSQSWVQADCRASTKKSCGISWIIQVAHSSISSLSVGGEEVSRRGNTNGLLKRGGEGREGGGEGCD